MVKDTVLRPENVQCSMSLHYAECCNEQEILKVKKLISFFKKLMRLRN